MTTGGVSALDRAFLCLEQDAAPMHLGAVAVFVPRRPVQPDRVAEVLAERAQRISRLQLRVRRSWLPPGHARWEEPAHFHARDHVHTHQLPSPGGREELAVLVAELGAQPLDLNRPLWELHVITGLDGDRFAVLVKLHHALADGCRAIEAGVGLLDGFTPDWAPRQTTASPADTLLDAALRTVGSLSRPRQLLGDALSAARDLPATVQQTFEIASSVVRGMRVPALDSPLHARASAARRVALIPIQRRDIRRTRARHGGTTNDVALAVVAGALRRWLDTRGYPVDGLTLRALVPVNHRSRGKSRADNNQLSGYLCDLPVGEPDPATRLQIVRAAMDRNKNAGPLRGPGAFPVLAGRMPSIAQLLAAPLAGHAAGLLFDIMITNVPLPNVAVSLDGASLRELYPLAPLAAGHALSIAVTEYRDTVHIGVQANRRAVGDLEKLSEALPHAVAELDDLDSRGDARRGAHS
ncbi:wax ester/triacylglycerol synthase family O-acyltransferase [Saccharopolyspora phatthalungensis]|uniref:Diacylglycerol O-acyltransferase n=1 Tax=Saccharopolyspora phatthalungensis TaxID=664693 RepID=A0A840QFZ3_9PSEU|nr:wax ester/triacylglycerol synthase family O-acyltransferase [Saccharopolyspora phatthalungensis]MBB5156053.1 WS/DGAT/MGAT family acyltransferase [Saccharopolyspora phatthalungensis]